MGDDGGDAGVVVRGRDAGGVVRQQRAAVRVQRERIVARRGHNHRRFRVRREHPPHRRVVGETHGEFQRVRMLRADIAFPMRVDMRRRMRGQKPDMGPGVRLIVSRERMARRVRRGGLDGDGHRRSETQSFCYVLLVAAMPMKAMRS